MARLHATSTIRTVIAAVKHDPGRHARTYAVKLGLSAATVSAVIQAHRPEFLRKGFLAVHPNKILQPDWYLDMPKSHRAKVPLIGYEGAPVVLEVEEDVDPALQKLLEHKRDLYVILTRSYDMPLTRRKRIVETMVQIDHKIINTFVLDQPSAAKPAPKLRRAAKHQRMHVQ